MGDDGKAQCQPRTDRFVRRERIFRLLFFPFFLLQTVPLMLPAVALGQTEPINPATPLPSAPLPIIKHQNSKSGPCRVILKSETAGKTLTRVGSSFLVAQAGVPPLEQEVEPAAADRPPDPTDIESLPACPPPPIIDWYERFINGPEVKPLTPREKARLAAKNVLDPFNAVTILGNAAITIGANSHTAYGPGMPGFARLVGVSYAEDMTNEFFGTFVIPSIFHQDPHYHRMPGAPIPRRILHAIIQVGWTQGDNGKGMPNYAMILAPPIDAEIADLYVPGEQTDLRSTAARVAIGWGLAPTNNFISEFLPDIARHIHVEVIFVQQIINQVARTEPAGTQ